MSYRKKHIKSRIDNIKPKKSIFKKLWFWITILIVIIILSAFYFVLFYPGLQLRNIVILGNANVKTQDLQDIVSEYSNTGLINFGNIEIASRSIFLINESKIREDILEKFPEVEKMTIDENLPQTLILNVTERKPIGVFCDSENKCFMIDENGIIFSPTAMPTTNATIVRQTLENSQAFSGENVIDHNTMNAIYKIQKSLEDNFHIDLKEALVAGPTRLNIETSENWEVYFDISAGSDVNLQLTKLNLLLSGGISEDEIKNLRYIDLRPKDKAIICDNKVCGG